MRWMLWIGCFLVALTGCGVSGHDADAEDDAPSKGKGAKATAKDAEGSSAGDEDEASAKPDDDAEGQAGAGGEADTGEPTRALYYYADAKPIMDAKCVPCHVEGGIAPMPLTTFDEVEPFIQLINADVKNDVMPPWIANMPFDYFEGDRRLSETQKATLLAWIKQGAKEGDPEDEPEPLTERTERALERVDLTLQGAEAYTPQIEPDDYRCFPLEWPYEDTKYITGINIAPDDRGMVHHAILYHVQPENAQATRDRDAMEEGPGYQCFGSTSGGGTSAWLQSYEPGGYAQGIPGNLGFEVRPGSLMVLQVHYNTLNGLGSDRSKIELTIEDEVERVGRVQLIMDPTWIAGTLNIPAGMPDVAFAYRGGSLTLQQDSDYGIYWVDLHMHQLGSSGRVGIIRAATPNQVDVLLDIPKWDFRWQETYMLREPDVLHPGDQLYVECHFDNTPENQTVVDGERLPVRDVNWGEGTTDEMCLGNVLLTPL